MAQHNYGVQAAAFTEQIYVGRLNKARTMFLDGKVDGTDMVLAAVAQYVERNFAGGMEATFPGIGLRLNVRVEPMPTSPTPNADETGASA